MPIVKRKPVQPVPLTESLEAAHARHDAPPVFYLAATGEVFAEYEQYAARLSYYHQRLFQCEVSGKSNLTYFEAAESEAQHTRAIQAQFPDALKAPILQAVQFQTVPRMNELVERVVDAVKTRYFPGETVLVDRDRAPPRQAAMVRSVHPATEPAEVPPLTLALDATPPLLYEVQINNGGETVRVRASQLSRERHAFSKSIVRRFLRDSVSREPGASGVWRVRLPLARKYALPTELPPELAQWQQSVRNAHAAKRRRVSDNDAARKRPASDAAPQAAKVLKYPCEDTRLDALSAAELQTETPGELPRRTARPALGGEELLGVPGDVFEAYLAVYYFFLTLGEPLGISSMALDDFESALRHPVAEPPCVLLAEMHAVLLNAIVRDGPHSRDLAPAAVAQRRAAARRDEASPLETPADDADVKGPLDDDTASELSDSPEREVLEAAREIGRGWQRSELHDEVRTGWERHLVGCLVDRATPEALPRLLGILSHLTGVSCDEDTTVPYHSLRTVAERYPLLPLSDKIHVLQFLCELAVLTRNIKAYYEECETHLTELRKERMDLSRNRKRMLEQQLALDAPTEAAAPMDVESEAEAPGTADASDSDSERDELASDDASDDPHGEGSGTSDWDASESDDARDERYKRLAGSRQEALREKAQLREAEAARVAAAQARAAEQVRETKQLREERRRLEETAARLARRDEALDREFRRYAQIPRLRPLGRDRFLDRYYWLDGIGAAPSGAYQAARIFVQAPSRREWEALGAQYAGGREALAQRRSREHGTSAAWVCGAWGVYTQPEQVEELIAWLRPHGVREHALKAQLLKYRDAMEGGMRRRTDDIALGVREPAVVETRRSARVRSEQSSQLRLPYMQWRNTARP
ncbi:dolichyl-P-Glc:Glc1Man9GlcNAc2-PP-dolichol alpha-1,3-glucosyltransferase [Malassezia nana]|uniref:Dolichyl-P-Glc:Glc1Man9GlcNAc2-PP-dolichol alpha-1,3-glucosyltransferase n=1 Tax=Malassezia nana TaxID=180528 RepID=A0AAF0ELZ7_9BASI|nr:dolichyl-P-Glc:Glc1Man9GlcNAc2-PP-dolichol alpha-1,3-glucosyltransferase [Malassezia nana]